MVINNIFGKITTELQIVEMAILDKIPELVDAPEHNQFGFRPGSSTDQCVFLLKERIRSYVRLGGPVYCCFLDATKAFDRVCQGWRSCGSRPVSSNFCDTGTLTS